MGWISVDERLPNEDEKEQEVVALYFEYGKYFVTCDTGEQITSGIHTHWLSYPKLPGEK